MKSSRRWLAATLLAVLLPMSPIWTGRWVFFSHDLRHHYLPWRAWAARTWASGQVPMWSSEVGLGFPLMADAQTGVFYPANMIFGALFDPWHALSLSLAAHVVWAALGTFILARSCSRSAPAAALAAVVFALGGFLVGRLSYAGMQHVAASFPWLLWAALRLNPARTLSWRGGASRALVFGALVAAVLTAGHPQLAVISLMGAAGVFLGRRRPSLRALGVAAGGAVVGIFAAAPQLLATAELSAFSARAGGVDAEFAGMGSLPPWELINLALPRFWGWEPPASIALSYMHKGAAYFGTGETHWEGMLYLGVPTLVLAALAGRRGPRLWWGLVAAGAVLALGRYTPVYGLVHRLPGLSFFRFPARYGLWMALGLPMLAAWSLDHLPKRAAKVLALSGAALASGGLLAASALPFMEPMIAPRLIPAVGPERVQTLLSGMLHNGTWGLVSPVSALVLAGLLIHRGWARFLPILLAVELSVGLWGYNAWTPIEQAQAKPESAEHLPGGLYRVGVVDRVQPTALDQELMSASMSTLWGGREVILLSPLRMPGQEELLHQAGLDVGMDHGPIKATAALQGKALVDLWGVRRLYTVHTLGQPYETLSVYPNGVRVYENPQAYERAWFVDCASPLPLARLQSEHLELDRVVAMERGGGPCMGVGAPVELEILDGSHQRLQLNAPSQGFVVIAETFYPGWSATIGDARVPLRRADQTLRAIPVEPGPQVIELAYEPPWAWSLPLAALAWLLLGVHLVSTVIREGMRRVA